MFEEMSISNEELTVAMIPSATASYGEIEEFALTYDGYNSCGSFEKCAEIANAQRHSSLDDLRTCLFFEQRRWRHFGCHPDEEATLYIRQIIERIRRLVMMESECGAITVLPCLDSEDMAQSRKSELDIPRNRAAALGHSAVKAAKQGFYLYNDCKVINWSQQVNAARTAKVSIQPDIELPMVGTQSFIQTQIQITNETTLGASRRLIRNGLRPLALNFANGLEPGGGFLSGARAQEETLCRSSSLYETLLGDQMYAKRRKRPLPDSTDWVIYSPEVPVFRADDGTELEEPWLLDIVTCAAPYAPRVGQPDSGNLLQKRILRVLKVAQFYGYSSLILGAWGCGAFENDVDRTAKDFRSALENEFDKAFEHVVFAIADWSSNRKFLGPFRDVFAGL